MKQNQARQIWILFGAFTLLLAAKCLLFHWSAFQSILVSSLWKAPLEFFKFYLPKFFTPMFIASFIFISKRLWWTWVIALLTDIWAIANSIYYKANDSFLTVNDILMVGNLRGFEDSILTYLDWTMAVMLLLTIVWIGILYHYRNTERIRRWKTCLVMGLLSIALSCVNNYFINNYKYWGDEVTIDLNSQKKSIGAEDLFKFYRTFWRYSIEKNTINSQSHTQLGFIRQQSILDDFIYVISSYIYIDSKLGQIITLSESDINSINSLINHNSKSANPKTNLIIILVESMESWPLSSDELSTIVTPSLSNLLRNNHVLFADKIKSQVGIGRSGDGQMIINTSLLPISNGNACMLYPNNVYPNLAGKFTSSCIINPTPGPYNQDTMTVRYGYKALIEPDKGSWQDEDVFSQAIQQINTLSAPFCVQAITITMHVPFAYAEKKDILKTDAPGALNAYLQCYHYTDSCIGALVDSIMTNPELSESTTIVITGDHTTLASSFLNKYHDYAVAHELSIASGETYCPLIIYSPNIEGNQHISDLCYQMDIYPTILNSIGCDSVSWRGVGVNLLDSTSRHNRTISEEEAYRLSDLIIRSDYFHNYSFSYIY